MKRNPSYVLNKYLLDLQATVNKYGINKHTLTQNIYWFMEVGINGLSCENFQDLATESTFH